jgi:protein-L-isoaspartate(D-aspartate) O-methyltransferase
MRPVDIADDLAAIRRFYAEELEAVCGLDSKAIVEAFATVPRERFLGPGPWSLCVTEAGPRLFTYRRTADDNPRHVYHNVAIAIHESRILNNGQPGTIAGWFQWLDLAEGERIAHIGCGTGYYSAILAVITGPTGSVLAFEVDPMLAAKARENLSLHPNVAVGDGDGSTWAGPLDVIVVNAGTTHAQPSWLEALRDGGRMLLPLTFEVAPNTPGKERC